MHLRLASIGPALIAAMSLGIGCTPPSHAHAGPYFDPSHPFSPDQIAFGSYLNRHYRAYFLRPNERIGAGDTLDLYEMRVQAHRKDCFPNSKEPQKWPLQIAEKGETEKNLSGAFKTDVGVTIDAKIDILDSVLNDLSQLKSEYFSQSGELLDDAACPWMHETDTCTSAVSPSNIVLSKVIHASGEFGVKATVKINGDLTLDVSKKLRAFVFKYLGDILPDLDISGGISGSYKDQAERKTTMPDLTAVAFVPQCINEAIAKEYYEIFRKDMEEQISRAETGRFR